RARSSSSSRNRSTTRLCRALSSRDSPTMRPASSTDRAPISARSDCSACCRSASICSLALSTIRRASAWACSLAWAMICAPCSSALRRTLDASTAASFSFALYCSRTLWASSCAFSARCSPPSMASVRSSSVLRIWGTSFQPTRIRTTAKANEPTTSSEAWGSNGLLAAAEVIISPSCQLVGVGSGVHERHHETDEGQRLDDREAQQHVLPDHVGHLGLARHGLHALAEDDPDADAGAEGGQTVPDGADVPGDGVLGGEDEGVHWSFPSLSAGGTGPTGACVERVRIRSVLGVQRTGDVAGRQHREDERLQSLDEHLEAGHDDRHQHADDADGEPHGGQLLDEEPVADRREEGQQNVAREHVGEQSHRVRERPEN